MFIFDVVSTVKPKGMHYGEGQIGGCITKKA